MNSKKTQAEANKRLAETRKEIVAAIPFYDYQTAWFMDRSRFKVGMFTRQGGKTFVSMAEVVDSCHWAEANGKKEKWVILSRSERQSKLAIDDVKKHCRAYNMAIEFIESDFKAEDDTVYNQLEVILPGGSRIIGLPANPDTARGHSANVVLDEFDLHKNQREIWAAVFPIITNGDLRLIVISTPKNKNGKFYELITGTDEVWSRHIVDIYDAVKGGLKRDIELLKAALKDPDIWKQEFELEWLDEATAWLTYDMINAVEHQDAGIPSNYQGGSTFVGNDIAIRNHLWVAWVKEQIGDVLWTREISILHRQSFANQDAELDRIVAHYNPVRICMDQTGLGEKPVEDAKRRHGELRVEGVLFNTGSKQMLATLGRQSIEDKKERIPQGDQELRDDMHSLKRFSTANNNVRFDTDGTGTSHADRTWAGFLATYAASSPAEIFAYEAINKETKDNPSQFSNSTFGGGSRGLL